MNDIHFHQIAAHRVCHIEERRFARRFHIGAAADMLQHDDGRFLKEIFRAGAIIFIIAASELMDS